MRIGNSFGEFSLFIKILTQSNKSGVVRIGGIGYGRFSLSHPVWSR